MVKLFMKHKNIPGSPEEWMKHAESDITFALLGASNSSVMPEQVCFHAQQSVEKSLKAILLFKEIEFPLTHDIEELIDIAQANEIKLPLEVEDAGILTPYAVETRYPGAYEEIVSEEVTEALDIASKTLAWAKTIL